MSVILLSSKLKLNNFFHSFPLCDVLSREKAQALEQAGLVCCVPSPFIY